MIKRSAVAFCLLSVSFVVAFHVCKVGARTGVPIESSAVYAASDDAAPSTDMTKMDPCHVCTAFAVDIGSAGQPIHGPVPVNQVERLISALPKSIGPPPKS